MCGIVGSAGGSPIERVQLEVMCNALAHRGPDDTGMWYSPDGTVGIAHRRLAIVDLSPGGHQPMADASGRVHVAFNGEIYNFLELREELRSHGHAFHTSSDTEVMLAAYRQWGEGFLSRLIGMFAMVLYDDARRMLYLVRDRAGEKPLFWWRNAGRIVFASELKALFGFPGFPRRIDREALEHYLAYGYVPGELCMIDGVRKLAPGSFLRLNLDNGELTFRRYWDLPEPPETAEVDAASLERELESLLLESVRRQMIADVPVGILLSGGVDSSLITAMAARVSSRPVKTFTISFPGHGKYDEAPYARAVARHFGTEHLELPAQPATVGLLPLLARQYDEPIADSSMVPTYMVARLIREHATVALGGDGGDELFGGYPHYVWAQRLDLFRALVPGPLRRAMSAGATHLPRGIRGRNHLMSAGANGDDGLTFMNLYFDREWRRRLLRFDANGAVTPEEFRVSLARGARSALQSAQRIDFRSYMVDDILVKVDRASMLTSLETRAPFLDAPIIEFVFGKVPDHLKVTLRERKVLLRRLAHRLLPGGLDLRRKQGFSIPLRAWLAGEWGTFTREVLTEADPALFDRAEIAALLAADARHLNNANRIFALTIFELWRREYNITV
ncbi:MAG: asparagine synthase (glutamine-hydrolyzing) [Acidobacteriota bacterium]|nr:asparagine synthase (glutamine-hydrolyzing) [Acidobacteriota bacterium]